MKYKFSPKGVCSKNIEFDLDGSKVSNISFEGGCNGNLKAIAALCDGFTVKQLTDRLLGITCGLKKTSCSDQLAKALLKAEELELAKKDASDK